MSQGIRVTVEDIESGEIETKIVRDDWVLICDGTAYLDGVQKWPKTGTVILTIKHERPET